MRETYWGERQSKANTLPSSLFEVNNLLKILVPVKLTLDVSQLKFESSGEPIIEAAPKKMGDADKCAVEEAVRLKEKLGAKVSSVTVGSTPEHLRMIRDSFAMGVEEGYLVRVEDAEKLDILTVAELLHAIVEKTGGYDLILMGAGSGDTHSSMLGAVLSSMLRIPLVAGADEIRVEESVIEARCLMEDGSYTYRIRPPAVVTVTSEANEPRIPSLKAILASKKIPIKEFTPGELKVTPKKIELSEVKRYVIPRKKKLIEVSDASELEESVKKFIEYLKTEGIL